MIGLLFTENKISSLFIIIPTENPMIPIISKSRLADLTPKKERQNADIKLIRVRNCLILLNRKKIGEIMSKYDIGSRI